jgi:endonuclease-3
LMTFVPRKQWVDFSHQMIQHGRRVCLARKPRCETCPFAAFCPRCDLPQPGPTAGAKVTKHASPPRRPAGGSQTD